MYFSCRKPSACVSRFAAALCLVASVVLATGCSTLVSSSDVADLKKLPALLTNNQLSQDSVIVEVGFVPVPDNAESWRRDVWAELDEQHIDPELRRTLAANGFRCGLSGTQLPMGLRTALDIAHTDQTSLMDTKSGVAEQVAMHRRIQTRAGKRSEVVMCSPRDSMVLLLHEDQDVVGRTFQQAQPLVALRSFPLGDGRARIELTPEIQHGPSRQRWIGQDGAFQLDAGQHSEVFSRLVIETAIAPGQTLVIAGSSSSRSLGGNFFGVDQEDRKEKMLLIRLAQSQYDDLFSLAATETAAAEPLPAKSVPGSASGTSVPEDAPVERVETAPGAMETSSDGLTIDLD